MSLGLLEHAHHAEAQRRCTRMRVIERLLFDGVDLNSCRIPARRPKLVIGFAAETDDLLANAQAKLARKGADAILANDVSLEGGVMGGPRNTVRLVTESGVEDWPTMAKADVARRLVAWITERMGD